MRCGFAFHSSAESAYMHARNTAEFIGNFDDLFHILEHRRAIFTTSMPNLSGTRVLENHIATVDHLPISVDLQHYMEQEHCTSTCRVTKCF